MQIAPGVHIYTATHPVEAQVRRSGLEYALPVSIQDGVWLGPRYRLSRCYRQGQYGSRSWERGHPGFAVQCGGSRKSLSRHSAAMKQPGDRATFDPLNFRPLVAGFKWPLTCPLGMFKVLSLR